ncbi:MAG: LysR family transcriptional regulator [Pseudomonadota bacterium]
MEHWSEMRSALAVARLGTVLAAANALGVHRATVNRHIDTLESHLGVPLFQRHARGFSLTDSGRDMLDVAGRVDELLSDFRGRTTGLTEKLSGSLKVTALTGVAPLVIPVLDDFHALHSDIELEFIANEQLARLEYGEAHVAIRAGLKPTTPDYVVVPFRQIRFGLYASEAYIAKHGKPSEFDWTGHCFVGPPRRPSPLPYAVWLAAEIPQHAYALRTTEQQVITASVSQGLGLGFVAEFEARNLNLVDVIPASEKWSISLWLVTHVDLRRTLKVQEFIRLARQHDDQAANT